MSLGLLIITLVITILYADRLPDRIPHHFNFAGEPNGYGGRKMIWSLPVFGVILYTVLTVIGLFIRMVAAGERVPGATISRITGMLLQLKLVFSFIFLYLLIATIRISLGKAEGLGRFSSAIYLGMLAAVLAFNIISLIRTQKKSRDIAGG